MLFYRKDREANNPNPHIGLDYPINGTLLPRHNNVIAAATTWPRIVRVRIEWAEADNDASTEPTVIEGNFWDDESRREPSPHRNDVLLLYRKNAAKKLLGFK